MEQMSLNVTVQSHWCNTVRGSMNSHRNPLSGLSNFSIVPLLIIVALVPYQRTFCS